MSKNHHKPEDEKKSIFEKIRNKIEPPEQAIGPKTDITMPAFSTNIGIIQPIKIEPTITIKPQTQVKTCGVLDFLLTTLSERGKNLSLLIAYKILTVPS